MTNREHFDNYVILQEMAKEMSKAVEAIALDAIINPIQLAAKALVRHLRDDATESLVFKLQAGDYLIFGYDSKDAYKVYEITVIVDGDGFSLQNLPPVMNAEHLFVNPYRYLLLDKFIGHPRTPERGPDAPGMYEVVK